MAKKPAREAREAEVVQPLTPVVFKCKVCGVEKPIEEMKVYRKYFPPMVLCKDCEKTQE